MEAFTFNTFELILLSAAGVLLVIQLFYYLGIYNRIHTRNIADKKTNCTLPKSFLLYRSLSVHAMNRLICASFYLPFLNKTTHNLK
jgi:hypothetical protein